jgi:hypothetical protein
VTAAVNVALAVVLVLAAALKLREPRRSSAALAVFGISLPRLQLPLLVAVCALELAIAAVLLAGVSGAAYAAAALFGLFTLATPGARDARARVLARPRGLAGARRCAPCCWPAPAP